MSDRIASTAGALYGKPRLCAKRRRCDGHLAGTHWIEIGAPMIWSALPPDNPEIGNAGWWHAAYCADCWPDPPSGGVR